MKRLDTKILAQTVWQLFGRDRDGNVWADCRVIPKYPESLQFHTPEGYNLAMHIDWVH